MRLVYKIFIGAVFLISALQLAGQTANVIVDVGVSFLNLHSNNLCTAATQGMSGDIDGFYDCAVSTGLVGTYTFQDPIPSGGKITNIEVIFHNAQSTANNNVDVEVGNGMVMGIMSTGNGQFNSVVCPNADVRGNYNFDPLIDFGYTYGGLNVFQAMTSGGIQTVCFTHAEIIFTYQPENPIPTMGQWSLFILALCLSSLAIVLMTQRQRQLC